MAEVFALGELANATNQRVVFPPGKGNLKGSEGQDSAPRMSAKKSEYGLARREKLDQGRY